jgi:uncharacterized protein (DUF2252 family)
MEVVSMKRSSASVPDLKLTAHPTKTRAERRKLGKALRDRCGRTEHALWKPRSGSIDPIEWIERGNEDRIAGLIPVRYGRMAQSALHFFRGTAIIQAHDLANDATTGVNVQLCGDCHLSNFGGFATPERALAFDINDFDETYPGPWEWDLKRLAASFVLAARYRSFSDGQAEDAARAAIRSYRERMDEYAEHSVLDMWYAQISLDDIAEFFKGNDDVVKRITRAKKKAQARTSEGVFPKLTVVKDGHAKIVDQPPLIYHYHDSVEDFEGARKKVIAGYLESLPADRRLLFERFQFQDTALKVVGVGSVGTRCFISLYLSDGEDPLFLQIKEARRSVLDRDETSIFEHQGARIVNGQRLMQSASDILLGWADLGTHQAFVRQLRDMKISVEVEATDPNALEAYGSMCGWALARAHGKAGDAATIAGYLGSSDKFDDALIAYSVAYADQVERDFAAFQKAIRSGRLKTDVDSTTGDLSFTL